MTKNRHLTDSFRDAKSYINTAKNQSEIDGYLIGLMIQANTSSSECFYLQAMHLLRTHGSDELIKDFEKGLSNKLDL